MSELLKELKTSIMLRVSGCRHEMVKDLFKIHDKEKVMDMVSEIYLPFDDPDEDDAIDISIDNLATLTLYLTAFKDSHTTLFITTTNAILRVSTVLSDDHVEDIHVDGSIEYEKINADLQGRIDKSIDILNGH